MIDNKTLTDLIEAQRKADEIRRRFAISNPQTVLFLSPLNQVDDDKVVVEADGFGASTVRVVEGNFPIDFLVHDELRFGSEAEGVRIAQILVDGSGDPQEMLLEYSRRNSS